MNADPTQRFKNVLDQLETKHLRRALHEIDTPSDPIITLNGRSVLLLGSNNYLGLANHPTVKKAAISAIHRFGVGSGASRLISGTQTPHQALERALAKFKGTEAALSFSSGYLTNMGIMATLIGPNGLILADRLCHASLIDGCRLSGADFRVFHHNDLAHLKRLLAHRTSKRPVLIVTEGVFSMDGDVAPLPEMMDLAQTYEARIFLDDAHGTGVMGPHGRGTIDHFGLDPQAFIQMGTLSKALGTSGGYVVGSSAFIHYAINTCRSFIYTTAPPPAMAAAARAALTLVQDEPERRDRLWQNRQHLCEGLMAMGYELPNSQSPILPLFLHDPQLAQDMSQKLLSAGVYVPAIRPPTVPKGTSRLRITVTSEHTAEHIEKVLSLFRKIGEQLGIISL